MAHFKGGRGKKVTYETQMYRIPTPLRPTVEEMGLQFRLLWDGLTDPTGEKLISGINQVIADLKQPGENNGANQISNKSPTLISDIKLAAETEESAQYNGHSLISGNAPTPVSDIRFQELERELQTSRKAHEATEQAWKAAREELEATKAQVLALQDESHSLTQKLASTQAETAELRSQLQDAGTLIVELRAKNDQMSEAQQNVGIGSNQLAPIPPELLEAEQDFPAEVVDDIEVTKELSDDSIPELEGFGLEEPRLEEVEEKHTSTATVATATKTKSSPVQLGFLPETETAPPQEKKPRGRSRSTKEKEAKPKPLTRPQLAKKLKCSSAFIQMLESKGKLGERGYALVEGTGTSDENPPKYQPLKSQEPT